MVEVSVLKLRIKFTKQGEMRFIGHLDLMRFFQKALRKSGIDIRFSEGMSPHMILSFASPLGLGLTSTGEYADIEAGTVTSSEDMVARLNAVMCEGIRILDIRQVDEGRANNAMALLACADYAVRVREDAQLPAGWTTEFERFMAQDKIEVEKETKKGVSIVDIRPLVHEFRVESEEGQEREKLVVRMDSGSKSNLKPELLMETYFRFTGQEYTGSLFRFERLDMYARSNEAGNPFVSLNDLGRPVEG